MEGWGKIGVQRASVLYPNSCYNESCYIEVQVYYNLMALIFVSHLYGVDYLPFNQPSTKFEKNYKIR